jgi:hypothetical protein
MAWSGIPEEFRHIAWQMLLVWQVSSNTLTIHSSCHLQNYLPLPHQPRLTTLARKRREYAQLVEQAFGRGMTPADAQASVDYVRQALVHPAYIACLPDMASDRNRCAAHSAWGAPMVLRGHATGESVSAVLYTSFTYCMIDKSLERILYVRAMRNPASGYVQGINDLVTPFFEVFLGAYISKSTSHVDHAADTPVSL